MNLQSKLSSSVYEFQSIKNFLFFCFFFVDQRLSNKWKLPWVIYLKFGLVHSISLRKPLHKSQNKLLLKLLAMNSLQKKKFEIYDAMLFYWWTQHCYANLASIITSKILHTTGDIKLDFYVFWSKCALFAHVNPKTATVLELVW